MSVVGRALPLFLSLILISNSAHCAPYELDLEVGCPEIAQEQRLELGEDAVEITVFPRRNKRSDKIVIRYGADQLASWGVYIEKFEASDEFFAQTVSRSLSYADGSLMLLAHLALKPAPEGESLYGQTLEAVGMEAGKWAMAVVNNPILNHHYRVAIVKGHIACDVREGLFTPPAGSTYMVSGVYEARRANDALIAAEQEVVSKKDEIIELEGEIDTLELNHQAQIDKKLEEIERYSKAVDRLLEKLDQERSAHSITTQQKNMAYDTSKAAANHLVRELAIELAPLVRHA